MLKDLINKEVSITYELGYSYGNKKGVVTKVTADFITIDNKILIASKKIIKVSIKDKK